MSQLDQPTESLVPLGDKAPEQPVAPKAGADLWHEKIDACKAKKKRLTPRWRLNVSYRVGRPFDALPDTTADEVNVPVDWARTKSKQANLFFQVPNVKTVARSPQFQNAAPIYGAAVNFELEHTCKAHIMMDEVLADTINAAGLGVGMLGVEADYEDVPMPAINEAQYTPEQLEMILAQNGGQMPVVMTKRATYLKYFTRRISPINFLWPADFVGSDWQEAEWLGYEGLTPVSDAKRKGWIDDSYEADFSDKIETLNNENDQKDSQPIGKYVRYKELFYRRSAVDADVKDCRTIGHLVFVEGKREPVVDEDFKWQKYSPQSRQWIGLTTYPIKVLTLTTITDDALPPSDSEIGRPQVMELNRSRSQMVRQRDRSLPLRWFDVNMVDEMVAEQMRKGVYQDMIPMDGPGDNAIGEVARANYPRESFEFQNIITNDLDQAWAMGANQQGFATPGDTSATEAELIAGASDIRLDYERAKVLRFFLEFAEGIGSLMQLFQDEAKWVEVIGQDGFAALQAWDRRTIRGDFLFKARPDAAIRVDVGQKRTEALNIYKLLRRDPLINPNFLVMELLELHGLDPAKVMAPPAEPQPKPSNIRYSFGGADLANPLVVALVQKNSPTPIEPEDVAAAKKLMADIGIPELPAKVPPMPQPGKDGQPPSLDQLGGANDEPRPEPREGQAPELAHAGPAAEVTPLNQRYEMGNTE